MTVMEQDLEKLCKGEEVIIEEYSRYLKDAEAMLERHTENAVGYNDEDKNELIENDRFLITQLKKNIVISTDLLEELKKLL